MSDGEVTSPSSHTVSVSLAELFIDEDRKAKRKMKAEPSIRQR